MQTTFNGIETNTRVLGFNFNQIVSAFYLKHLTKIIDFRKTVECKAVPCLYIIILILQFDGNYVICKILSWCY